MAREPQLHLMNQRLIDGAIDVLTYFREIGPFLGLSLVIMDDEVFLFSDRVTFEVFKASDRWQKDLSKRGMPFVLTGQTGLQVVAVLAKLATSSTNGLPKELRFGVDVTHTCGLHIANLNTSIFITLQLCLELERLLLSDRTPTQELTEAIVNHQHLHIATMQKDGQEMLAFFRLANGQNVIPVFSAPDLAFGALGNSPLGLYDLDGTAFLRLIDRFPQLKTDTIGLLFNPYSNTEKLIQWQNIGPAKTGSTQLGQSA